VQQVAAETSPLIDLGGDSRADAGGGRASPDLLL
jgi:hypothetical protein